MANPLDWYAARVIARAQGQYERVNCLFGRCDSGRHAFVWCRWAYHRAWFRGMSWRTYRWAALRCGETDPNTISVIDHSGGDVMRTVASVGVGHYNAQFPPGPPGRTGPEYVMGFADDDEDGDDDEA